MAEPIRLVEHIGKKEIADQQQRAARRAMEEHSGGAGDTEPLVADGEPETRGGAMRLQDLRGRLVVAHRLAWRNSEEKQYLEGLLNNLDELEEVADDLQGEDLAADRG